MAVGETGSLQIPARRLYGMLIAALLVASIVVLLFVLPAEFRLDPTGFGRASGLLRLAGPKEITADEAAAGAGAAEGTQARYYETPYRSDVVDIPLAAYSNSGNGHELEYKVRMKAGATLVYSWSAPGIANPEELYFDLHGEAPPREPQGEPTIVQFKQASGTRSSGMLIAPLDGIFGWYLQNQSERPGVVHLKLAGFYDLIPPGEYGNDAAIEANRPLEGR